MEYLRLIKKSVKSKTLFQDFFGYGLIKLGFADKYLAGQVTMYRSYNWVKRHFIKELNSLTTGQEQHPSKKRVWICWLQGIENAPKLVRDCYHSVEYWLSDWEITVVTADNYNEYTELPAYIQEKWKKGIISNTHFSDILRLNLLIHHGGLWLDATTLLTGPLPKYITDTDFFVYRNGWMDMEMINMASWLIYSNRSNNALLFETQQLLYAYWNKYDYLKNYFLMHMFFRMVTDKYKEQWDCVPYFHQIDCHFMMNELEKKYDRQRIIMIKQLSNVHKLTYKLENIYEDATVSYLHDIYQK